MATDNFAGLEGASKDPRGAVLYRHFGIGVYVDRRCGFCRCKHTSAGIKTKNYTGVKEMQSRKTSFIDYGEQRLIRHQIPAHGLEQRAKNEL